MSERVKKVWCSWLVEKVPECLGCSRLKAKILLKRREAFESRELVVIDVFFELRCRCKRRKGELTQEGQEP